MLSSIVMIHVVVIHWPRRERIVRMIERKHSAYGSTHALEICGQDHTVNEIFDLRFTANSFSAITVSRGGLPLL